MESYTTNMNMDIKNDKQTINYKAKQTYLRGGGYNLELNKIEYLFIKATIKFMLMIKTMEQNTYKARVLMKSLN